MTHEVFTHARWHVLPGQEEAFIAAWDELAAVFGSLAAAPVSGTLLRSTEDESVFYSFGPWRSTTDVLAMRTDPAAVAAFAAARALCRESSAHLCTVVRHVDVVPVTPRAGHEGAPPPANDAASG